MTNIEQIYCDHENLLHIYQKSNPLPANVKIVTFSPKLRFDKHKNLCDLNASWNRSDQEYFYQSVPEINRLLYQALSSSSFSRYSSLSSMIANRLSRILYYAASVDRTQLKPTEHKITILSFCKPSAQQRPSFIDNPEVNPIHFLLNLFTQKHEHKIYYVPKDQPMHCIGAAENEGLINRIKLGGFNALKFRLKKFFSRNKNTDILVLRENELLIDTLANLNCTYRLVEPYKGPHGHVLNDDRSSSAAYEIIQPIIEQWVDHWVKQDLDLCASTKKYFQYEYLLQFKKFEEGFKHFEKHFKNNNHLKLLCTGSPSTFSYMPVIEAARSLKIPTLAFQHGVCHEICKHHDEINAFYDSSTANFFIGYSQLAIEGEKRLSLARAKQFCAAGASSRHLRLYQNRKIGEGIIYVSTLLLKGIHSFLLTGSNEVDNIHYEISTLEVLRKTQKKIFYKPYPAIRLFCFEEDPVLTKVMNCENFSIMHGLLDLRFILHRYHLIISSRATSTITWILLSNVPFIYIERHHDTNLTTDAKKALEKSVFYLDITDPQFSTKLDQLVKLPREEIIERYKAMKVERDRFIHEFISNHTTLGVTEGNACNFIRKKILLTPTGQPRPKLTLEC